MPIQDTKIISQDVVSALYNGLLFRAPDDGGLSAHSRLLEEGKMTVQQLLEHFLESEEFRINFNKFKTRYANLKDPRFCNDLSQFGEVELLVKRIVNESPGNRIVVDVGVRGRDGSNSYDLMHYFGWKGLLIEANPRLILRITEEFSDVDMKLVSTAISDFVGEAEFFLGSNDAISSLNEEATAGWGPVRAKILVPVRRLPDVLREHDIPDDFALLSLDIEGEDIKTLNDTIDRSPYRPRWVIIEASYDFKTSSLSDLPFSKTVTDNYEIVERTQANLLLKCLNPVSSAHR